MLDYVQCANAETVSKSSIAHAVYGRSRPSMLDFWNRLPRSHTFYQSLNRPPSTALYGRRRP